MLAVGIRVVDLTGWYAVGLVLVEIGLDVGVIGVRVVEVIAILEVVIVEFLPSRVVARRSAPPPTGAVESVP